MSACKENNKGMDPLFDQFVTLLLRCGCLFKCAMYRPFSHCIDQAGLGAFTAKSGRKHYNPPPLTVMWMNFDSPNSPSFCSLSAIISFQTCSNKYILYVLSFHKCIKIKYKMVNKNGVFRDYCEVRPAEILYTLIASTASSLVFSWVFGSVNSVTWPDQYNAKMVYTFRNYLGRLVWFVTGLSCHMEYHLFFAAL